MAVSGQLTVWNEVSCLDWVSPVIQVELTPDDRQWLRVLDADPLAPEGSEPAPGLWFAGNAHTGGMQILNRVCPSAFDPNPEPYRFRTGVVWLSTYDPQVQTDIWTQAADTNLIEGSYVRVSDDGRQEWSWRLERANPE